MIDKGPSLGSDTAPLLFVHGAWHGAWCWDEHFLDFFAAKGYRSLAVSLRGHGKSPVPKARRLCSVADYVEDVASVADGLPTRPVLVGHSLGGFVVQKYLEQHDAPCAVLLASIPPSGITRFLLGRFKLRPWLTARSLGAGKTLRGIGGTPELARESFFSPPLPDADVERYAAQLGEEYVGKWVLDLLLLDLPKPNLVTTPVSVLGAENDIVFTQREVRATAAAYHTEADFVPKMAHDVMLEPGWAHVAERIHAWIETRCRV